MLVSSLAFSCCVSLPVLCSHKILGLLETLWGPVDHRPVPLPQNLFLVGHIIFSALMVSARHQIFPLHSSLPYFSSRDFSHQACCGPYILVGTLKVLSFNTSFNRVDFLLLFSFGCAWGNLFFLTGLFQCQVLVLKGWGAGGL